MEIQLNSLANKNSSNKDNYIKFELKQNIDLITEYDVNNLISINDVFEKEYQDTNVFRIYGNLEYLSLLNGIDINYYYLHEIYLRSGINKKTLINSFDFYLLKPTTGYTSISGITGNTHYIKKYEVISNKVDFEIYNSGYYTNIYNDINYLFNFSIDFDISDYYDNFNFPITGLYLYCRYNIEIGKEKLQEMKFNLTTGSQYYNYFTGQTLNIGDKIDGELIYYDKFNFNQSGITDQNYLITTPFIITGTTNVDLIWTYNPLIPIRLRYLSDDLRIENISGDTNTNNIIPDYATNLGDGNFIWRDIMQQGFVDPISNKGTSIPFVNNKKYCFIKEILSITPYLTDNDTYNIFKDINYNDNILIINSKLTTDLNKIGKTCPF